MGAVGVLDMFFLKSFTTGYRNAVDDSRHTQAVEVSNLIIDGEGHQVSNVRH